MVGTSGSDDARSRPVVAMAMIWRSSSGPCIAA
jgi:hypothetical protein